MVCTTAASPSPCMQTRPHRRPKTRPNIYHTITQKIWDMLTWLAAVQWAQDGCVSAVKHQPVPSYASKHACISLAAALEPSAAILINKSFVFFPAWFPRLPPHIHCPPPASGASLVGVEHADAGAPGRQAAWPCMQRRWAVCQAEAAEEEEEEEEADW